MGVCKRIPLFGAIALCFANSLLAADLIVPVGAEPQKKTNWCWAACTQEFADKVGRRCTQEEIVSRRFYGPSSRTYSQDVLPNDIGWMTDALDACGIPYRRIEGPMSIESVRTQLLAGRTVAALFYDTSSRNRHYIIINGVSEDGTKLWVWDPFTGLKHLKTPAELTDRYGTWERSIYPQKFDAQTAVARGADADALSARLDALERRLGVQPGPNRAQTHDDLKRKLDDIERRLEAR